MVVCSADLARKVIVQMERVETEKEEVGHISVRGRRWWSVSMVIVRLLLLVLWVAVVGPIGELGIQENGEVREKIHRG